VFTHFAKAGSGFSTKLLKKDMKVRMQNGTLVKLLDNARTQSRLVEVVSLTPAVGDTGSIYVHDIYCAYLTDKLFIPIKLSGRQIRARRVTKDFFRG
jgi:hypothetical protein